MIIFKSAGKATFKAEDLPTDVYLPVKGDMHFIPGPGSPAWYSAHHEIY